MSVNEELFDKCGGYRKLHSFTLATLIHLETINFCKRFIPWQQDTLGKIAGQMIGAARSGRQNIIEASERAATSKETEIKLTDVARASFAELLGDYEMYLAAKDSIPWSKKNPKRQAVGKLWLPEFEYTDGSLHDYWQYFKQVKVMFAPWFEDADDITSANTMLILIKKTMVMLHHQIQTQGSKFVEKGGFREKMYQTRSSERDNVVDPDAPACPDCGKPMQKRKATTGSHQGESFWGCTGYPECKGILPCEPS